MTPTDPIYLDYHATTPVDARVMDAMRPWFEISFGNAHSIQHSHGQIAEAAVETARRQVADLIGAEAREIIFTSGATEANNMAVKGVARHHLRHFGKAHIVVAATEHKCVLESAKAMEREGARVTVLPVRADGLLDLDRLADALADDTVLVSIMAANNEIGTLQDMAAIGALCAERDITFHTDAAQMAGKLPVDVRAAELGLLSLTAHKMFGPKGIGALFMRRRPRVRLEPLFDGGGQERGLRSGTVPVPLVVGLGAACAVAQADLDKDRARMTVLRDRLLAKLRAGAPDLHVNGTLDARLPNNLNVSFPGIEGVRLMGRVAERVSVSAGSACRSADVEPSYVLKAIGLSDDMAAATLRFCMGRTTTEAEIDAAADHVLNCVDALRESGRAA